MTNSSIYAAFERMWQHVVALVGTKAESNHDHDDMYYTEAEVDAKLDQVESDYESADSALSSTLTNSINGVQGNLTSHTGNQSNPHGVTKAQVGLENVDNTADINKPVSTAQATAIADAKKAGTDAQSSVDSHTSNKSNPHGVTKSQIGLGNVENKSSETIRSEITKKNVTDALGYTPPEQNTVYTHPSYTARTGVPTANQTPAFGGTFQVTQPVSNATGHITGMNSRTITIPATEATTSKAGLMSPTDKTKLNNMTASKVFTATIGTSWTENADTGAKSQKVTLSGVLATDTAKVDVAYTGNGSSESYAEFVEQQNQFLDYITNGYAETVSGGVTFYIFGEPNTVNIPIIVEVG